ncbi:PE-PPE domain-containing protein [Mycobacterium sp. NAZ190054]|uniref:PE-PPE domain-containing protein n=1 Tax=Mycobacterium sp. NAZ190054 TaxID=1747766 RepID=UPI000AF070B4|nr:PE-PPE domain-containing protein [Mycobacterium sp. NAZ190054]
MAAVPFAALPLAFGGSVATAQLVPDGPATVLHHGPTPWAMDDNLGGELCAEPKVCRAVDYQWILPLGTIEFGVTQNVRALDRAISDVSSGPEDTIVYAFSGGARVASVWLRDHGSDHEEGLAAPSPDDLSFVLIGNGGRKYGGLNGWWYGDRLLTPTDTDYAVVDVAREYDPIADFPANPFNLLALANAIAAFDHVHMAYGDVDLDDPDNIVWTEGNTTYVHVPTSNLPLLQGFRDFGLGWLVDDWEAPLREIIDRAYDRTWLEGKEPQGEEGDETLQTLLGRQGSARTAVSTATAGDEITDEGVTEDVEEVPEGDQTSETVAEDDGTDDTEVTDAGEKAEVEAVEEAEAEAELYDGSTDDGGTHDDTEATADPADDGDSGSDDSSGPSDEGSEA